MGTGPKALRAVGGSFFKLWESEGKINRPEHTAGGSQNKGTEKLQRRAAPSPLEVGGRGGERGKLSPREATPSHPANRSRFLSEDFLRPDRRRALGPRREKAHRARGEGANLWLPGPLAAEGKGAARPWRGRQPLAAWAARGRRKRRAALGERPPEPLADWAARRGGKRRAAPGERAHKPLAARATRHGGKRRAAPGERAPKPLAAWAAQAGEGTKRRHNRIHAFVEDPKTRTALNAGPAPYRAAGSLSSVDGESTDTPVRGKQSVARTRGVLPTHSDMSAVPRPPRSRTELN